MSTSGASQAIRKLEEQIGVRLLTRTTRSVSPTDAGEQLLAQLRPALSDIRGVLMSTLSGLQSTLAWPTGHACTDPAQGTDLFDVAVPLSILEADQASVA